MIYPISFSIPTCKIANCILEKTKLYSIITPKDTSTYIYKTEEDYYNDYKTSIYGFTQCKGGWDCLRHYEILANGCIPYFEGLENCPVNTMIHLPKNIILEAMASKNEISKSKELISFYSNKLLEYTKNNLSSKAMASYILKTIGKENIKSVLFLSTKMQPDYQRCLTLIGFKELLGNFCHDYPCVKHIYKDMSPEEASRIYGRGFTYSRIFNKNEYRNDANDITIENDIIKHKYDLIIFGKVHDNLPFWDLVNKHYSPNEIILLCGEDLHNCDKKHLGEKYNLFIREL